MPKRKKKTTAKKRKEEFSHEDTPPPAKKVDTTENEASSTSHIEEDNDPVQYFTSISIQNKSDANDLSHYWCNYCSFSTDTRKDLIAHMREHMNKCPFCSFASLSLKEVSKHSKIEHDKDLDAVSQESDSSSSCEMDKDPCSACIFCEFMTYSTEHLERHTVLKHPGLLAKSVAKMITKQSSAQIRRDDALFYLTISNENMSEMKKSTTEHNPIVIDMKPDIKSESRQTLDGVKADQFTKLNKERGETLTTSIASTTSCENQSGCAKDEISSSGTVLGRKVKVETMYCLTCPYSNVYIEKLKCHTLAQHPLGAAVCTYNSSSENSTEQDVSFFCIREDCSYNTGDSRAYQKHLMECCSCRSTLTVLERERLQASIAYINSFQKKTNTDAERSFSNFAQSFLDYPDSPSSSVFHSSANIVSAGRDPLFINKDTVPKLRSLSEMQQQAESITVSRQGLAPNAQVKQLVPNINMISLDSNLGQTPDMYPVGVAEMKTNLVNTSEEFSPGALAFKLGTDILHSSVVSSINQLSSSTSSVDSAIRNTQQNMTVDISNSILMSRDHESEMNMSQNSQENLNQSADSLLRPLPLEGMTQSSDMPPFYHDGLNNSVHMKPTSTVIDLNDETWQKSQHNSSIIISSQQSNILHCQSSLKTSHVEMPATNVSDSQTSVPNFLVTTNSPMPETESNIESQTQPTFLTPSKNAGMFTHSLSTPPKNTNNLANAAGSSPLSPSIYLSGQAPRHKRGNWTEADMRPRGVMMPPVASMVPQFVAPPGHIRQQLFTSGNMRGRGGRGRARMPPNSSASVEDDDVIVTAVVRNSPNIPNIRQPAIRRGRAAPPQSGRMVPMPRHPVPPSPSNRGRSLLFPQAPPPKQFDISKHFEDLACVVNSTGDENDGNPGDDDIQILGVTPGKEKEKTKHPRAVDASKFSFSCLHCGKDQGSKLLMKQHMKAHHNDSLIGAFTNIETGQLLFFCPKLTCEFMTYEEQRLSEHLYKCYNLDHSKPFDVLTAIKNLKSVKVRQLDVKSMGRFQDNAANLDGQGLKDNFSNSLNDAFDDIVVSASGRHMPKPSPVSRQVPPVSAHPSNLVSPRHSSVSGPPLRHQSAYPAPRQRFYPQPSPYGMRPSNSEIPRLAHQRLPNPRLDMRMARGMFPRSRGQIRSPMRPLLMGPRFGGGEQEPIVIDDEPPFPVSNILHSEPRSSSLSSSETAPSGEHPILDHSPAKTFEDNRHVDTYSSSQEIVKYNSSNHQTLSVTREISDPHNFQGSVSPVHVHEITQQAYSYPDVASNPSTLPNESVSDRSQLSSESSENIGTDVSSTALNNSVNTPRTNLQTSEVSSSEPFSVGASEDASSFEEEEKSYADMLEKVFAKVPNMPKKLSYRLISKFKQYSKDIGAKITSNVIDEFVSKISYRGSSAAKAIPSSAPLVTEQLETSCKPKEHTARKGPGDHGEAPPDHCIPDVLTTQVIMAEREIKFSGSFANLPLTNNDNMTASGGRNVDNSCQELSLHEQNSSSVENLHSDELMSKTDSNSSELQDGSSPNLQSQTQSSEHKKKSFIMHQHHITRRHSTEIINVKSDTIRDIRSSSCPLTSTKDSEWRIGKVNKTSASFQPYTRKIIKKNSPCVMTVTAEVHVPTIQAVIEDDYLQPAITQKENSLSLISSISPILITSNVDHLVSGHADLEVDIAGKPENHNLLLVEKQEPPDALDHASTDSQDHDSPPAVFQPQEEHVSADTQSQNAQVLVHAENNNEAFIIAVKKSKKISAVKKRKNKNCSLIDSKTGMLIPKVTKRGRPRTKFIRDLKLAGEKNPFVSSEAVDNINQSSASDVPADQNVSCKDDSEPKGTVSDVITEAKPLNTDEAEIQAASPVRDIKGKDDDEKSNEDDSLNKENSCGSPEIFVRRSDRKRKCITSDYRGEEGTELDDLLDDSDEDYNYDDDDTDNDESTWMKQSGLAPVAKKKIKKVKPPPDPTAFNVSSKGQFRCWMCKKVFLKSTCAKAHLLKKHKEGLCSIDLVQTEETNVLHLLLYCVRDCKYATFSLEGYKSHMAICQKPEYASQDENYLESNKTFIDVLYPELMKTDAKDFLQNQSQKVNKNSKTKKSKTAKDKVAVTVDDISGGEQPSISPPLQGAACETVPQSLSQPSLLNLQHLPQITPPAIHNKLSVTSSDQQFSRMAIPPAPRINAGQHNQRIMTPPDVPKSSSDLPPKLSPQPQRLTAEYHTPRLSSEHHDLRVSAEHHDPRLSEYRIPRLIPEQCAPRLSPIQHPSLTFDKTGSRFAEHLAQPVRPPMQSKHNPTLQSTSFIRPVNQPAWHQVQKIPGSRYPVGERHSQQGPRLAQTSSRQTVPGQTVNLKVQEISSSTSQWQNRNHLNVYQQDIDTVYVEENGTICLE